MHITVVLSNRTTWPWVLRNRGLYSLQGIHPKTEASTKDGWELLQVSVSLPVKWTNSGCLLQSPGTYCLCEMNNPVPFTFPPWLAEFQKRRLPDRHRLCMPPANNILVLEPRVTIRWHTALTHLLTQDQRDISVKRGLKTQFQSTLHTLIILGRE